MEPDAVGYSPRMIALGLVLLLFGLLTGVGILWTAGVILVIGGLVLMFLDRNGRRLGRAHYW
ncbi:MAG: hypothetical protein ACXV5U_09585 [Ilumatobacteraceae bacterium]